MNLVLSDTVFLPGSVSACRGGSWPLGGATRRVFKRRRTLGTSVWPSSTTRKFPSVPLRILRPAVKAAGQRAGRPSMRTPGRRSSTQSGSGDSLGPFGTASRLFSDLEPWSGADSPPPPGWICRVLLSDASALFSGGSSLSSVPRESPMEMKKQGSGSLAPLRFGTRSD